MNNGIRIGVVIPCYNVRSQVMEVIAAIPEIVCAIYIVDDCCPQKSGLHVKVQCKDSRVKVIYKLKNEGVGGAVMTGMIAAMEDGIDIIVKLDGDGQMDPKFIPVLVLPIVKGEADYTKGNRFYNLEKIHAMPIARVFGNAALSFMTKLSSGYWDLFDPTNGYTAIHREVARHLPLGKISRGYFFETDMLFRLNTLRAVVVDIPMDAKYGDEISNLKITRIFGEFLLKHVRNGAKRIFYNYYLRDMSIASIELPAGLTMFFFGLIFGGYRWIHAYKAGIETPAGTVMLAALPLILGFQLILAFFGYDISSTPRRPLHLRYLKSDRNIASNGQPGYEPAQIRYDDVLP